MKLTILTLFPEMFEGPFSESILKHAQQKNLLSITLRNIRDFGEGKHQMVDDTAYGGGVGMVMRVDVVHKAIEASRIPGVKERVILMSASGISFVQSKAREYSHLDHLIIICGHYEGIDARILKYIDEEITIGDFVTTGGEIPAMLITDAVARLIPGVLKAEATANESFSLMHEAAILLEYPHYTRPSEYDGVTVPEVLRNGDHKKIAAWKQEESVKKTKKNRPELLKGN